MMTDRFFSEDKLKAGTRSFEGAEFHHMVRVTRHQVGDTVRLFDGAGKEADATITFVSRTAATLKVGKVETIPVEDTPRLILAAAVPKASRSTWLIEKAVELGVSRFVPLRTARGVVDPRHTKLETLRNNVIAASKQSGRSRLMEISPVTDWTDFIKEFESASAAMAHPGGVPFTESLVNELIENAPIGTGRKTKTSPDKRPTLIIAIGPEGGFTVEEVTLAMTRGATLVSLGPRILRVETAGLMAASVIQSALLSQ